MEGPLEGLLGFVILALVIWAIIQTVQSRASGVAKTLWILFLLLVPVIGLVVWAIAGPRPTRAN